MILFIVLKFYPAKKKENQLPLIIPKYEFALKIINLLNDLPQSASIAPA
jgi:hypothetical protein